MKKSFSDHMKLMFSNMIRKAVNFGSYGEVIARLLTDTFGSSYGRYRGAISDNAGAY